MVFLPACSTTASKQGTIVAVKNEEAGKDKPKRKESKKKKNPRDYFTFRKDGSVKTKSGKAEKTFNFPDVKIGFLFDPLRLDILPVLAIELYEFKKYPFYFDIGLAPHIIYFAIGYNIIPIFEIGVFLWGGYNFIDRKGVHYGTNFYGMAFGLGVTILKF